jgi:hypothetical protein
MERFKVSKALNTDDSGKLDKEAPSYDNVLDAFRLSLQLFKLKCKSVILYQGLHSKPRQLIFL